MCRLNYLRGVITIIVISNNNNNNNNNIKNENMHREITAFLQHIQDILATSQCIFTTYRSFLQHCVGHFYRIQKIILSAIRPGSEVGYISFNSTISLSDEAVQCKSNKDLAYYILFHNSYKIIFIQRQAVLQANVHFVIKYYMLRVLEANQLGAVATS